MLSDKRERTRGQICEIIVNRVVQTINPALSSKIIQQEKDPVSYERKSICRNIQSWLHHKRGHKTDMCAGEI